MKNNWNIAFEISPLLAASGSFGDKSGVFRLNYNLIKYLSLHLKKKKLPHQIYLYTLNPSLQYNIGLDLYKLMNMDNVHLINTNLPTGRYLQEYKIFDFTGIRFLVKKIDKYLYISILENIIFSNYLITLTKELKKRKVKVIHHSESGFAPLKGFKSVIHINDLVPLMLPFWQRKAAIAIHIRKLKFASKNCDGVICISKNTKKDFLNYLKRNNYDEPKIKVTHLAAEKFKRNKLANFTSINNYAKSIGFSAIKKQKYLLYFGTIEPRKNTAMLVSVFDKLHHEDKLKGYKLVLMGGKGWGKIYKHTQGYLTENYPVKSSSPIVMLDFLNDEHLATLIENAYAVVYPSVYEGFGLPILESFQLGTPVITSNTSSLPEVGGDACLYIEPTSPKSLENAILQLTGSPKLRQELSEKGLKQAKKFSWANVASQTFQFYRQLVSIKPN